MRKMPPRTFILITTLALLLCLRTANFFIPREVVSAGQVLMQSSRNMPIFHYPVVEGSTISGHFDHTASSGVVTFYDGRRNNPGSGFYFQCSNPYMYDWVGCQDNVAGEPGCANNREIWYDNHRGTDYEYSSNWHTGATCDPGRFSGITANVYAPARGRVFMAGYDANRPGNGWHIRLQHDLNGNGNYADDNFRSIYLHFTANALAVTTGQIVQEGQYLGLGGSTGYSSSPHLHFEIQKSNDYFQSSNWSVDPYGWSGAAGTDPWGYQNLRLWIFPYKLQVPLIFHGEACTGCGELLGNNGFEGGKARWVEKTQDIIIDTSYPSLPIAPYEGNWLAWLGGRNNAVDVVYQDFTVPTGLRQALLRYMLYISTDETGGANDYLYVRVRTPDGTMVQDVEQQDNTFGEKGRWVQRSINLSSLLARGGQTLRIEFKGTTSDANYSNFYIDDVSITAGQ